MELDPGQVLSKDFCGMSYEPGKSLHQPPWAMRTSPRPAGIDNVARVDIILFHTLLISGLRLSRRDVALSHHGPIWLIPLILTVRADMPQKIMDNICCGFRFIVVTFHVDVDNAKR